MLCTIVSHTTTIISTKPLYSSGGPRQRARAEKFQLVHCFSSSCSWYRLIEFHISPGGAISQKCQNSISMNCTCTCAKKLLLLVHKHIDCWCRLVCTLCSWGIGGLWPRRRKQVNKLWLFRHRRGVNASQIKEIVQPIATWFLSIVIDLERNLQKLQTLREGPLSLYYQCSHVFRDR